MPALARAIARSRASESIAIDRSSSVPPLRLTDALSLEVGAGGTARARAGSLRRSLHPRSGAQGGTALRRTEETRWEVVARLRLEVLEDREMEMDAKELNLKLREQRLAGRAAEELRRQQDQEGEERRRLRHRIDALVREMRRSTATRPFSRQAEELEQLQQQRDLQDEQLRRMAEEPLEQPNIPDEEPAPSEFLGSSVVAQSEVDIDSSADTDDNLEHGLAMVDVLDRASGRKHEGEAEATGGGRDDNRLSVTEV